NPGKPPEKLYDEYFCGIPSPGDDVEVWLVDGEIVRDLYKVDFIEGGNDQVYRKWLPKGEIWIEKNLKDEHEICVTILHEYVENTLMKKKHYSYDKAHNVASKVEFSKRGKKWDMADVKSLNRDEALKMANKI